MGRVRRAQMQGQSLPKASFVATKAGCAAIAQDAGLVDRRVGRRMQVAVALVEFEFGCHAVITPFEPDEPLTKSFTRSRAQHSSLPAP